MRAGSGVAGQGPGTLRDSRRGLCVHGAALCPDGHSPRPSPENTPEVSQDVTRQAAWAGVLRVAGPSLAGLCAVSQSCRCRAIVLEQAPWASLTIKMELLTLKFQVTKFTLTLSCFVTFPEIRRELNSQIPSRLGSMTIKPFSLDASKVSNLPLIIQAFSLRSSPFFLPYKDSDSESDQSVSFHLQLFPF